MWSLPTGWPSKSTTMMSASVSRPLSRPETVIAAWRSSRRREKLLLVAGVQPRAASSRDVGDDLAGARGAGRRRRRGGRRSWAGSLPGACSGAANARPAKRKRRGCPRRSVCRLSLAVTGPAPDLRGRAARPSSAGASSSQRLVARRHVAACGAVDEVHRTGRCPPRSGRRAWRPAQADRTAARSRPSTSGPTIQISGVRNGRVAVRVAAAQHHHAERRP